MQVGQCRQVSAGRSVRSVSLYIYCTIWASYSRGGADLTKSARYASIGLTACNFYLPLVNKGDTRNEICQDY